MIRFTNVRQIVEMEPVLKAYINEAIELEKAGLKVKLKEIAEHKIPEELQNKFSETPALKMLSCLNAGTAEGVSSLFFRTKQSKTRASRIEKCTRQILDGKGSDD